MSMTLSLPERFARAYPPDRPPRGESNWLLFRGEDVVVSEYGSTVEVLRAIDVEALVDAPVTELAYLGILDGTPCIAGAIPPDAHLAEGLRTMDLRSLFDHLDPDLYAVAGYGYQLLRWRRASRFCAFCGGATQPVDGEWGRRCGACNHVAYPHVSSRVAILSLADRRLEGPAKCLSRNAFYDRRSSQGSEARSPAVAGGCSQEARHGQDRDLELGAQPDQAEPASAPPALGLPGLLALVHSLRRARRRARPFPAVQGLDPRGAGPRPGRQSGSSPTLGTRTG